MTLEKTAQPGIFKRGAKHVAIVSYKDQGRPRQKWITRSGFRAVQQARRDFLNNLDKGIRPDGGKMTVEGLFAEWLTEGEATKRALTIDKYTRTVRLHILPAIGHMFLKEVDRDVLRDLYRSLPSPVMARYCHFTLSACFGWAVKDRGLLAANPCAAVRPPKVQRVEAKHLELDEARRMLQVSKGHPLEAAIILGLVGGLRIAEAVSVTWEDVDLESGSLLVRGSFYGPTKSGKPRGLTLPAPQAAALKRCKARQAQALLRLGIRQTERTPILAGHLGDMRAPKRQGEDFKAFCEAHRFNATFHTLRHSAAVLMLTSGVDVKTVASRLGHANPTLLFTTYSHFIEAGDKMAADRLEAILNG